MADITHLFSGGAFRPPNEPRVDPPEVQLIDDMIAAGLTPPDRVELDGKIHRFRSGTKGKGSGDKTGWYIIFPDGIPAGRFGCWREGLDVSWRADVGRSLSPAEEMAHARRMAEAKSARDAERAKVQEVASETVETIWSNAGAASPEHPYLQRKGIQPHGARITGDGRLIVPLFNPEGELCSLQYIGADGTKRYHSGAKTGEASWIVGTLDESGPVYVAEGYATAATIHEATDRPCIVAYSVSNILPVVGQARENHSDVVIVADNDESGLGLRYAEQASAKHGARVVCPPIPGDANDYAMQGHDLAEFLAPKHDDWLIPADDFAAQPAPISWLVRHWVQRDALVMVHGPSGGGKTFVVLDWCLRIASNLDDWMGHKVRHSGVVYLAGEGHHGLRGRVAAWKHHHGAKHLNMWLSKAGCDLNTAQGYQRAAEAIRALSEPPGIIVVDTLHRFLHGDENSAQDAKTMLDACSGLMAEFGCALLLVHHTGTSEEAQHRARGSSAWRGALDGEISVVPGKDDKPIEIIQRKAKDSELAEPVYAELESVAIPGWIDEDGEQVASAVIVGADAPPERKKESKLDKHRKMFEAAWWNAGAEEREGRPYLSRSAFMSYLVNSLELKEASARIYCKPSSSGKPVADLLLGGVIDAQEHGWIVTDVEQSAAMMMRKGGGTKGN